MSLWSAIRSLWHDPASELGRRGQPEPPPKQSVSGRRLAAGFVVLAYVFLLVGLLGWASDYGIVSEGTLRFVGGALTYSSFGLLYIAWRWPEPVLRPWVSVWRALRGQ